MTIDELCNSFATFGWKLCLQGQNSSTGAVDLENDGHPGPAVDTEETERAFDQRGRGLTQKQKNEVVAYHNKLRKQEGASNMEMLVCYVTWVYVVATFTCIYLGLYF